MDTLNIFINFYHINECLKDITLMRKNECLKDITLMRKNECF